MYNSIRLIALSFLASSQVTVFDIVGYAQKHHKGEHFCELNICIRGRDSELFFERRVYDPPFLDDQIPNIILPIGSFDQPFSNFEHFLQSVRKTFKGVSFQEIIFQATFGWQRVWERVG